MNNQEEKKEHPIHIVVNGQGKTWGKEKISFEEVIVLAYGTIESNANIEYTMTYKNGAGEISQGTMVRGDVIKIKNGTIFNATATNRS